MHGNTKLKKIKHLFFLSLSLSLSVIFQLKRGYLKNKLNLTNFKQWKLICTYQKGLCMPSRTKHLNKAAHTNSDLNFSPQSVRRLLSLPVVWNPLPPSLVYFALPRSRRQYIIPKYQHLATRSHDIVLKCSTCKLMHLPQQ